jgi:translation initiation factor 1
MNNPRKTRPDAGGFVYSTDPAFKFEEDSQPYTGTPEPSGQKLSIRLDSRHRGGKVVTLISGFTGQEEDLQDLARKLKNFCGTGGSAKNGEIIIQGDQREKILVWLAKNGFKNIKRL